MSGYIDTVFDLAMQELTTKGQKRLYQTDFLAWANDVLDRRYYEKMAEIAVEITTPTNGKTRTAVKSANGCGKSFLLTDVVTWWATVFPPEDSLAIISAPTLHQINNVCFKYLKNNYGYVKAKSEQAKEPFPFAGWINESLEWKYSVPGVGNENIVFGKRPTDTDIVSTFQGTRKRRTLVALDEGGGVPQDLFTAAEAVATGQESRIVTIGNPDKRGTEFHRIFTTEENANEWNLHTISAYDLPTLTGEIVYPDKAKQKAFLNSGLTTRDWVEHKERVWKIGGRPDARFLAKVLGEFPGETDNAFFPQEAIDRAHDTEIDKPGAPVIVGVDLAAGGDDESVFMVNRGGRVRLFDRRIKYDDGGTARETDGTWAKEDEVTSARRVHAIAMYLGAEEVRVDSAGLGGGVFAMLNRLDEFADKCYLLIGINGANSSADRDRWARRRDENHDNLRRMMIDREVDLDPADTVLRDELLRITYDLDNRGAIKITSKRDMKSEMGGSPDRLDAVIYATATNVYDAMGPQPGETLANDAEDFLAGAGAFYSMGGFGW